MIPDVVRQQHIILFVMACYCYQSSVYLPLRNYKHPSSPPLFLRRRFETRAGASANLVALSLASAVRQEQEDRDQDNIT